MVEAPLKEANYKAIKVTPEKCLAIQPKAVISESAASDAGAADGESTKLGTTTEGNSQERQLAVTSTWLWHCVYGCLSISLRV